MLSSVSTSYNIRMSKLIYDQERLIPTAVRGSRSKKKEAGDDARMSEE